MNQWKYVKLGEVCTIERGSSPRPIDDFITTDENGINWIKIGDADESMYITKTAQRIKPVGMKKSRYVKPGDFLLSNSMSFGRPYILKIDGCIHDGWLVLRDENNVFDKKFLYYYLSAPITYKRFKSMAVGGVVNNLNSDMVRKVRVPIPSQEEQHQISDRLDKVSNLIFLRKQQLAKLDELVRARFVEMFGDPISNPFGFKVESLQEMLDDNAITYHLDGNHGSDYPRNEEFVESGVSYISANCIIDDNVNLQLAKHLTEERAAKLRKGIAQDEDVLFAHNATVGPVAILHTRETKVVLGTSLTAYRCNKQRILPSYLKAYMQSEGFVRQYTKDMKQTTRNQVPITAQRKYLFIVPPLSLQNRFASFVERIDQQKQTVQQSLEKLEVMKKALMQEFFG